MKERTILQCAKCLSHTPLIETDTSESIAEAIAKHKHCGMCGHHVMLCFNSVQVLVGKGKKLSWRSANEASRKSKPRGSGAKPDRQPFHSVRVHKVRVKKTNDCK